MAATLHDIGKARIPLSILDKPGRLDPGEEDIMRRHPVIGYDLLKDISGISPEILDGVRHHHEYLDGSGYPDALMAPEISDPLRLLTISDIFAALIESRPYRPAMSRQKRLQYPVRYGRKAGAIAGEGVPERGTCGVRKICGSETNAAFTGVVNESGDFRCRLKYEVPMGSELVCFPGQTGSNGRTARTTRCR